MCGVSILSGFYTRLLALLRLLEWHVAAMSSLLNAPFPVSCSCLRYVEAARAFNAMLLTIARTRQFHEASPYFDQIMKKNEQLLALLAVSLALCPGATSLVEDGVMGQVGEKKRWGR